ncbi:RDD family protein [Pseudoxanthomonas sacheonensis]|uniref:RDD family membrane protein YckC n=1 Tax=Pseudoxanthomonas sacheonensis TaxID=443615 RepID=A0ABU1RUZ9_9GAMM|nr:RDD family protein [Pseudoxanthomonas sacheonensis]MDR6841939.1 putative RDD family membrane protein YckC [Pseudoxanthomonas sacheonensis]
MLDTYREVITPEGVALHLPVAGPVPRAVAWGIDLAIRLGILMLVGTVLALLGAAGQGLYLILLFLIFWTYPILFEVLWDGQTPGKKAMSLRVVNGDGAPVGWLAAITRNLLRTVDMLPFGYAAGLIACLADPHARRLGDMVAGTLVVHNERERDPAAAPVNAVIAPSAGLQPAEQAAVVAFGERAPLLTPARQEELANIVEPLTGSRGQGGVLRLYGMANWLLGRR